MYAFIIAFTIQLYNIIDYDFSVVLRWLSCLCLLLMASQNNGWWKKSTRQMSGRRCLCRLSWRAPPAPWTPCSWSGCSPTDWSPRHYFPETARASHRYQDKTRSRPGLRGAEPRPQTRMPASADSAYVI